MSQQSNPATLREALDAITRKCEQYWNEAHLCDAEVHAALESIHRDARIALAASGTHSLPPSIPDGSMATASENAGVVMDAHRQIVKAEISEARLDEALEIRKNFHGMAAGLTFGNLMDFVKWLDKHVSELEQAVAKNDATPLVRPGETGAVTETK